MDTKLIEKALHAAEQNMTDVVQCYATSQSMLVFGEAVRDMKNDGLKLVRQARAVLLAAVQAPAASEVIDVDTQRYEVQCRKFGTSEWVHAALAYTEEEALEMLAQAASSWQRYEQRIVSTTVIKRIHAAAPADVR